MDEPKNQEGQEERSEEETERPEDQEERPEEKPQTWAARQKAGESQPAEEPETAEEESVEGESQPGEEPETAEEAVEGEDEAETGEEPETEEEAREAETAEHPPEYEPITQDTSGLTPAQGGVPLGMVLPPGYRPAPDSPDDVPYSPGLWSRFFAASMVIVLAMAVATSTSILLYLSDIAEGLNHGQELSGVKNFLEQVEGGRPQTILIVGSDHRFTDGKGAPSRSDTLILLRLDPTRRAISLLSLPRDLKVKIPGYGVDRINAAYALGGPKLSLKTVRLLTGLRIHHLVNVNFGGFKKAVNQIDCVYIDVDQRYLHSNAGKPAALHYAEINLRPGYQRLCGEKALQYVRYRHTDNDIVRGARQQDFLREARQKIGPDRLIRDRNDLLKIFKRYTSSDIDDAQTMLEVLKLFLAARDAPVKQVHLEGSIGNYVTASEAQMKKAIRQFLALEATQGPRGTFERELASDPKRAKKRKRGRSKAAPRAAAGGANVSDFEASARQEVQRFLGKASFDVYYPTLLRRGSFFPQQSRAYRVRGPGDREYRAYKIVVGTQNGEYYGVMGTRWPDPPIVQNPSETRRIGNRSYDLFYDGDRLRLVAWRTKRATYWISNTLLQSLGEKEMFAIAKSMKRIRL